MKTHLQTLVWAERDTSEVLDFKKNTKDIDKEIDIERYRYIER